MGCSINNMEIINEIKEGYISKFKLYCNMCKTVCQLCTEDPNEDANVNDCIVTGIMAIGSGLSHLQHLTSCLNMPQMNTKCYKTVHNKICDAWEKTAQQTMHEAIEEEKVIAIRNGCVDTDGIPLIRVVGDASWAQRTYGANSRHNSASGVGALVGYNTRKVVFAIVKNKYCTICARAENLRQEPPPHVCFKNWSGTSSAMEAAALAEGFLKSEEMYGVRFHELVADGDSSSYKKILESKPYKNLTVRKIECRNHLLRNLCKKLRDISSAPRTGPVPLRKIVGSNILKMRTAVVKATQFRKSQAGNDSIKSMELKKDILNIPSHVFGEHKECASRGYFCTKTTADEMNFVSELKKADMYDRIMDSFRYLARHSISLICDVDSNYVEQFNSIVCKFVGGKRVNYTLRRSYQARCSAAVVSSNTHKPFYNLYKNLTEKSPGKWAKQLEERRFQVLKKRKYTNSKHVYKKHNTNANNKDYGPSCQKEDMNEEDFKSAEVEFLASLPRTKEERETLEEKTRGQASNDDWFHERRKLLTASNFGVVCRRLPHTSCRNLVNNLLYGGSIRSKAIFWGQTKESVVKEELDPLGYKIKDCGLIVDPSIHFLGATPDGLLGLDGIIEIKCPYSARMMTPEEGIKQRHIKFWKVEGDTLQINRKHHWYYQIQGQLHVTRRNYCILAVWTLKGLKLERILRNDVFWERKMEPKLIRFYKDCILPELVDPRVRRNMKIRDPPSILEAQEKRKEMKKRVNQKEKTCQSEDNILTSD